jgi:hypothetical protein
MSFPTMSLIKSANKTWKVEIQPRLQQKLGLNTKNFLPYSVLLVAIIELH